MAATCSKSVPTIMDDDAAQSIISAQSQNTLETYEEQRHTAGEVEVHHDTIDATEHLNPPSLRYISTTFN